MASEINTNELNRIQDEGRMPTDTFEVEDKKILEEVEEGKKSTEELPQLIPPMRILDEAQHNDIYKLILGPCAAEGFSVNQKILDLLKDKKIKPIELESTLDGVMQYIIKYVNENDAYPVMFTDTGKIAVEETVQKAQRTNRKVSQYVTSLAEDSGKSLEELRARETIFGLDIAMNRSKEEYQWIDMLFKPEVQEYKENFQKFLQENSGNLGTKKTKSGKDVITSIYSEEVTIALNIMSRLDELVEITPKTFDERKANVFDMLRIYNYLSNSNLLSQIPIEQRKAFEERILSAKEMIQEKCKALTGIDISEPEKITEIVKWTGKTQSDVEKIEDCKLYKDIIHDLRDIQIEDVIIDVDKQKTAAQIDVFVAICTTSDIALNEIMTRNGKVVRSSQSTRRNALNAVGKLYPDYTKDSIARVTNDEYAQVRLNVLREITAKKMFEEVDSESVYANEEATMSINEYNTLRVAVAVLKSSTFTEETKAMAVDVIRKKFPDFEITDEVKAKIIKDENAYELGPIGDYIQQESLTKTFSGKNPQELVSGDDFAYTGMLLLDGHTKSEMIKEMYSAKKEGRAVNIEVLNSPEYEDLLAKQIKKYDDKIRSAKKFEYLSEELLSYAKKIDNEESKAEYDEVEHISKLIETAKMLESKPIRKLDVMVKEYLIDYLPEAFYKDGELKIEELDYCFEQYLIKNGYTKEDAQDRIKELQNKVEVETDRRVNETEISNNIVGKATMAERDFGLRLVYEKRFEELEDTARFANYILSKKDTLSKEEQEELQGYIDVIHEKNDEHHRRALKSAKGAKVDSLFEHEDYDKNKFKPKYMYLEKEARKMVAVERITETTERLKNIKFLGLFQKEEIQGILGTYMGILNDFKNEEVNIEDYREMMDSLSKLMQKIDPRLVDEDGTIDEDKVLDKYNEIFGTSYEDTEKLSSHEETELLMRYARRLSKELGTREIKYRAIIKDDNLFVKNKLHEKLREDVHLDAERTSELISDVWSIVDADSKGMLEETDKEEYILRLALIEGLYGEKNLGKKGLSYTANLTQELEKKTLGIARMKLAEFFPEAFREKDTIDRTRLMMELQEYFGTINPAIADKLDDGITIFKAIKEYNDEKKAENIGPRKAYKTPEELLAEANAILKGEEKEKTYDDNVLVAAMTIKMLDKIGKPEMGDRLLKKLTKHMSETEKNKFVQDCNARNVDEKTSNAMRRVAGLINIERYNNQLQRDAAGESKIPMNSDDIADYLQIAVGALASCNELPNTEINLSAQKDITEFIKKLAPKTVNSKGNVDYKKLMNVVNNLRAQQPDKNGNYEESKSKEEFISSSISKANVRLGIELYRGRIDSRFTNKYYVPAENIDDVSRPISEAEMDRIVETRGEEIVVDASQTRIAEEERKKEDDVMISGEEFDGMFAENSVEIGGEEPKKVVEPVPEVAVPKVEQQVNNTFTGVHAETVHVADESWKENLPAEVKNKGFIANIFDKIKTTIGNGLKTVKDKIFGVAENNTTGAGNNDNNATAGATSGTGGVNKDEQNIEVLTGHGKIKLEFATPATQTVGTESKGKDQKSGGEPEHDEEVI